MSLQFIDRYYKEVDDVIRYGGSSNETAIRNKFYNLLNQYCDGKHLLLIPELEVTGTKSNKVIPDGTIKDALRLEWGYWESKDEFDDLDEEIEKKLKKGYPTTNILFEDSQTAVLIQSGREVARVNMREADELNRILNAFIGYERPEVKSFRDAVEAFKKDIPTIVETLRGMIVAADKTNAEFRKKRNEFLKICQESINPEIDADDIREMMIQHILTEEIFVTVFNEPHFHRENNIARELEKVTKTFFTGNTRRITIGAIESYYNAIKAEASRIQNHHEKQKFLKVVYENFYKAYNPKGADKLGIVYTPNEIVRFMVESADYLVNHHFGKLLSDKNVEILDPATGTGTFITELIEYFPPDKLEYKYRNELHCNEVAILPYYIANLNIEFTYKQKMGKYEEFPNICFVDTLDNLDFGYSGKQEGLDFGFGVENKKRIKHQNSRKISVIIGNPPYNANQANENDNNKNRTYTEIDKQIKATYIKESTAQKTKLYDMYSRFFRWATTRLSLNEQGILAFITNRSFINSRTFDGFRKTISKEFSHIYVVDLGGDVRENPKLSGTKHNVFGIQTGVAISFLVMEKKNNTSNSRIEYVRRPEMETAHEKLNFLKETRFKELNFELIKPDKNNNWLNLSDNDFESLIPVCSNSTKNATTKVLENSVFKFYSLGVSTNRDEWVFDFSKKALGDKIKFFIEKFNTNCKVVVPINDDGTPKLEEIIDLRIKWSDKLKQRLVKKEKLKFDIQYLSNLNYRPFLKLEYYAEQGLSDRLTSNHYELFSTDLNKLSNVICFSGEGSSKPFSTLAVSTIFGLDFLEKTQSLPRYRYDENGNQIDNITDWGLEQFQKHYETKKSSKKKITKDDIFNYTYAVLHNPAYREKYKLNLKREFPRLPFYDNFFQWADWGKELMDLHINYESAKKYPLKRTDIKSKDFKTLRLAQGDQYSIKAKLKADKTAGTIEIDELSILSGIPSIAWEYKLGNRSALEWILDQYKESTPKDPTIREKFNTYRFADYKEQVIELLMRVTTVSVKTMEIVGEMK